ncbi:MAG: tRNA-dihydrouridine synthase [bacterium]|nr:tRNA-dihydrouridine synthase [bacterium]
MNKNSNGVNIGFWGKLQPKADQPMAGNKPVMVLAPMADVTDAAFRRIIAKYSKWGGRDVSDEEAGSHFAQEGYAGQVVMWTEFVSADGLCHPKGREKLLIDLSYSESERPIVAQLFTGHPEKMYEAAKLVQSLGFDGLDINMGCPDRKVEKQCAGAALMKNSELARAVIRAAKEGAPNLPVSVKTRIGYNKNELEMLLPELLAEKPAVVTIHCRTRKEMSDVPARWEHVREAVAIRDRLGSKTLIFGNGDALNLDDARAKALASGADGVMLGRAIFGNPFLFSQKCPDRSVGAGVTEYLRVMLEHTKLFEELFKGVKNFAVMKKHYKAYVNGFDGAKELRVKLMEAENAAEVENGVKDYLKTLY